MPALCLVALARPPLAFNHRKKPREASLDVGRITEDVGLSWMKPSAAAVFFKHRTSQSYVKLDEKHPGI